MRQPICIWLPGLTLRGSKVAARLLSQHLNDKGRPGFSSKTEAKDQMEEIELCAPSSFGLALKTNYSTTGLIFLSLLCLDLAFFLCHKIFLIKYPTQIQYHQIYTKLVVK